MEATLPEHYQRTMRVLVRYAIVMLFVGLISGVLFQESGGPRKVGYDAGAPGLRWEIVYHLALVHGHSIMIGVVVPLIMCWLLKLGLELGGTPLTSRSLCWLTRGFVPFSAIAILLMLYKGYHLVLGWRFGEHDLAALHGSFLGGSKILRALAYGISHTVMSLGLLVPAVALWRSLRRR